MKIQFLSDLHLEFVHKNNLCQFLENLIPPDQKNINLIIAGDLCPVYNEEILLTSLVFFSNQYKNVFYVLGNHEFYKSSFYKTRNEIKKITNIVKSITKKDNLFILDRTKINIDNYTILGCTLWFDKKEENYLYMNLMSDFKYIKNTLNDFHYESQKDVSFLLKNISDKCIIISHHLPHKNSVAKAFKNAKSNIYFVNNNIKIFENNYNIIWIHGHTHESVNYNINNATILANPYGYYKFDENKNFKKHLIIDI